MDSMQVLLVTSRSDLCVLTIVDANYAMDTLIVPSATEAPSAAFSNCKGSLNANPACTFGGLCECEDFVSLPESGGCGGTYSTEMGDIDVNDVCAAYCGACEDVSSEELFEEANLEVATMSLRGQCRFSTEGCQSALSNMYSCAEEKPGIETVDPLIRNVIVKQGHAIALENSKLGHPSLHVDQEDQVVRICPVVETVTTAATPAPTPIPPPPPAAAVAAPAAADCKDTLNGNPACTFGGLCDCEAFVNAPQTDGGCNGVYKSSFGDVQILSVCAKYCGCPSGAAAGSLAPSPSPRKQLSRSLEKEQLQ